MSQQGTDHNDAASTISTDAMDEQAADPTTVTTGEVDTSVPVPNVDCEAADTNTAVAHTDTMADGAMEAPSGPLGEAATDTTTATTAAASTRGQKRPLEDTANNQPTCCWTTEWIDPTTVNIRLLSKGASVCLAGRGSVCLLQGTVSGHGFLLRANQWHVFECPQWSSWLVLESTSDDDAHAALVRVRSRRPGKRADGNDNGDGDNDDGDTREPAVPHGPMLPPHLEDDDQTDASKCDADDNVNSPLASFSLHRVDHPSSRPTVVLPAWRTVVEQIVSDKDDQYRHDAPTSQDDRRNIIAVAGAKGVGKSTLVRYLVHRFLSLRQEPPSVFVLDGDTGQAEFGPPGLLTLTHLTTAQPLWSLPHHHMLTGGASSKQRRHRNPLVPTDATQTSIFYGATTSQVDPGRYLQAMRQLVARYEDMASKGSNNNNGNPFPPLIVNLDGWVKGLGYQVLSTFLTSHPPSHVLQIVGNNASQQIDLSSVVVKEHAGSNVKATQVHTLPSYRSTTWSTRNNDNNSQYNVAPALSVPSSAWRDLRFVHYWLDDPTVEIDFSQNDLIRDEQGVIAGRLAAQSPYVVPWEALACQTVEGASIVPSELNACIVGLCRNEEDELPHCLGLGIIRAVDVVRRLFYILTPVVRESLQDVDLLVLGSVPLPLVCVFLGTKGCCFPYHVERLNAKDAVGVDPMRSRNSILRKGVNT